jgi:hypothetical protein
MAAAHGHRKTIKGVVLLNDAGVTAAFATLLPLPLFDQ